MAQLFQQADGGYAPNFSSYNQPLFSASNNTAVAPSNPSSSAFTPAFDTSVANSGYNVNQYLAPTSASQLANIFGGRVTQTSGLGGPNAPPPQNLINIPGMKDPSNAGILAQMVQNYGMPQTQAVLNAQNNYNGLQQAQDSVAYSNA